jgi:hypothetical protein
MVLAGGVDFVAFLCQVWFEDGSGRAGTVLEPSWTTNTLQNQRFRQESRGKWVEMAELASGSPRARPHLANVSAVVHRSSRCGPRQSKSCPRTLRVRSNVKLSQQVLTSTGLCKTLVVRDPMSSMGLGPWMAPKHLSLYGLVTPVASQQVLFLLF